MPLTHLLYLHGFRSSPKSTKARQVAARIASEHPEVVWWCPQLPPSPREAMRRVMEGIEHWPRESMGVIGSSLGGFYATHVAVETGCRAVVGHPAGHAGRDLARHIGGQTARHDPGQHFFFEPRYVDELRDLEHGPLPHPERLFAVIAKGDEVLDWREMTGRYPGSRIELLEGGDHALPEFEQYLDEVFAFLGLRSR